MWSIQFEYAFEINEANNKKKLHRIVFPIFALCFAFAILISQRFPFGSELVTVMSIYGMDLREKKKLPTHKKTTNRQR